MGLQNASICGILLLAKSKLQIPVIPEEEQTPVVKELLVLLEQFAVRIQEQDEEIARLKDEISILKGEKKRPTFKPSKLDSQTDPDPSENDKSDADGSHLCFRYGLSSQLSKQPPRTRYVFFRRTCYRFLLRQDINWISRVPELPL